jgi:transcriptional regulator with XRE-family HTH domain
MPKKYFDNNATLVVMNNLRNKETLEKFGENLKTIRTSKGLTLEQLAFDADIELSQVHRVEKGKINPTLTTLIALAKGLGITLAELVNDCLEFNRDSKI